MSQSCPNADSSESGSHRVGRLSIAWLTTHSVRHSGGSNWLHRRTILFCLLFFLSSAAPVIGQLPEIDPGLQPAGRIPLDKQFRDELEELASGIQDEATAKRIRDWFIYRDPNRLYVFLPDRNGNDAELQDQSPLVAKTFLDLRRTHAARLFDVATEEANAGDAAQAFMLLHEVLHEDPNHAEARRILGYQLRDGAWYNGSSTFSSKRMSIRDRDFGWLPQKYWRIMTDHFSIRTSHSQEEGERLGRLLESLYDVWHQVFYEFTGREEVLARRFASDRRTPLRSTSSKMKVVLFADHQEYADQLQAEAPGIETTVGYYSPGLKESYFFVDEADNQRTWLHETTHQLFQQSIRADDNVGSLLGAWALEGIATFMESMQDHSAYVTVGGFDDSWLQYARFRCLAQRTYFPLEDLMKVNKDQLQSHPSIEAIYSQSAGLAHYLMTGEDQAYRQAFVDWLETLYRPGRDRPDALSLLAKQEYSILDDGYRKFLKVDSVQLRHFLLKPQSQRHLVFAFGDINDNDLIALEQCENLEWLDLTATSITNTGLVNLPELKNLAQLFLGGTQITDEGIKELLKFPAMEELDLVGTRVTAAGLEHLKSHPSLSSLRLTATQIDDSAIWSIANLEALKSVDLTQSKVTIEGVQKLQQLRPDLKITHE